MYRLSLLPQSYKAELAAKEKKQKVVKLLGMGLVATFILLAASASYYFGVSMANTNYTNEIAALSSEIASYSEAVQYSESIARQNELLSLAIGSSPNIADMLVQIGNSVPSYISVNNLNATYMNGIGASDITGVADTYADVSDWMNVLKEIEGISDVVCSYTQADGAGSGISFALQISIVG